MRESLNQLSAALLNVGIHAAGMACTPEERARLQLCLQENAEGQEVVAFRQLRVDILLITREAAKMAQAAVSRAAAGPAA